ncbi:MAG TPA: MarR family transcriptional regulator [Acidimicrobiales bacterium]|nr:MarR family transcriptional regulator [Acidimicrobiales bacterium]
MTIQPSACPSGDEKVELFGLLLETNARLARTLGLELEAECDLPLAWFEVLLQLRRASESRLKMNQIADAIVHSTGGTTRLIDRLVEAGLVVRESCPSDRRAIYVAMTNAGDAKLDEALGVHLSYLDKNLAGRLSATERTTLAGLLVKLNASA